MELSRGTVCFSVDVEWATAPVIDDLVRLFDEHGVRATFFVTHAGVSVGDHERGIHPNFRRNGDTYRALADAATASDEQLHDHVVATTLSYAPGAKGVRAHSLRYDSTFLPLYRRHGIEYECSYRLPLVEGLRPVWQQHDIVTIPSYYSDYFDVVTHATGFDVARLRLDAPGLKVLDFHPNVVFTNVPNEASYASMKDWYGDPERLLANRRSGPGPRTVLLQALAHVRDHRVPVMTLGEVNQRWRAEQPVPWSA